VLLFVSIQESIRDIAARVKEINDKVIEHKRKLKEQKEIEDKAKEKSLTGMDKRKAEAERKKATAAAAKSSPVISPRTSLYNCVEQAYSYMPNNRSRYGFYSNGVETVFLKSTGGTPENPERLLISRAVEANRLIHTFFYVLYMSRQEARRLSEEEAGMIIQPQSNDRINNENHDARPGEDNDSSKDNNDDGDEGGDGGGVRQLSSSSKRRKCDHKDCGYSSLNSSGDELNEIVEFKGGVIVTATTTTANSQALFSCTAKSTSVTMPRLADTIADQLYTLYRFERQWQPHKWQVAGTGLTGSVIKAREDAYAEPLVIKCYDARENKHELAVAEHIAREIKIYKHLDKQEKKKKREKYVELAHVPKLVVYGSFYVFKCVCVSYIDGSCVLFSQMSEAHKAACRHALRELHKRHVKHNDIHYVYWKIQTERGGHHMLRLFC
jgi:hypothetical protein